MRQLRAFACLFYVATMTTCFGQEFRCPLEQGKILIGKPGVYSHVDPTHATTVFSIKEDNIQACLNGKVLEVVKSSEGLYTVIIRTGHVTVAYKYIRTAFVVKSQMVESGSTIGQATFNEGIGYCLDVSVWSGTEGIDASKLLQCYESKNYE